MSKIITVFGATGNQGGSVISNFLDHPDLSKKYKIRAVTRDTSKPSAKDLASKGCETVQADLNDPASLSAAVTGAYAVFAVTNYWEFVDKAKELAQGKAIADACISAGVEHLVWSSLPHTTKMTNGKLSQIDHFVGKAEVEEYIESKKGSMMATHYMPGLFMSNFKAGMITPGPDGTPIVAGPYSPDALYALMDIRSDTGKYVLGAIEAGEKANGVRLQAVSEWMTASQAVETIAKYGDLNVVFSQVPRDVYKGFLVPKMGEYIGEEMTQNMDLIGDYSYYGVGSEKQQAENDKFLLQGSKLTSFREYVEANKPWTV